jgi:hypothetical protein
MKTCTGGNGSDTTSAVAAWLAAGRQFTLATLYLIGEPDDPAALWLTDWESPLAWPCWGTFQPASITRGTVSSKIGLEVGSLDVTWAPKPAVFTQSIATASPYQLAQLGMFDNRKVRVWTVYMPTPGDANTYGCSELFGGRVADSVCARGSIKFTVNSFLDVVNQYVPTNVIELLNTAASYAGATPPAGFNVIPQCDIVTGNSPTQVNCDCTNIGPHHIFGTNVLQHGFLVFNSSPSSTLGGVWSAIQQNVPVTVAGVNYNQIILYSPLPWSPTPGLDTCYLSAASPINQADGDYVGFPYVPSPESAI